MKPKSDAIIIVAGGLLQVPAVQIAKELGLFTVVTDRNPQAPAMQLADMPVALDTSDVPGHIALARRLRETVHVAGVFTEGADVEVTVAETAHALGLPGVTPEAAHNCKNKVRMRHLFAKYGIPSPRFREVATSAEARAAVEIIGLPVMVKAVDNCASRGSKKVEHLDELPAAIADAKNCSTTPTALIEEFLTGPELSVETIVSQGQHYHLNMVDRPFGFSPYPIELGHVNPSGLDAPSQRRIFELVDEAARILRIDQGVAKADVMLTARGPIILEMTARLSGGFDCQYTSPLAHGVNYIRAAMQLALGKPLDLSDITPKFHRTAVCLAAFPPPGRIVSISAVEDARRMEGVKHILFRMGVGDVVRQYKDCGDRVCFVITAADTRREAWERAERALNALRIETKPIMDAA